MMREILIVGALIGIGVSALPRAELGTIEVIVVDEHDHPVAGAEVFAVNGDEVWNEWSRGGRTRDERDLNEIVLRIGSKSKTDEQGVAHTNSRWDNTAIAARTPGKFAFGWNVATLRTKLALEPDRSIAIQVLDVRGRPRAGVSIVLNALDSKDASSRRFLWSRRTSGDDGLVVLEHAQSLLRPSSGEFELVPGVPLREFAGRRFRADAALEQPIVIRLPETGSVSVRMPEVGGSWARIRAVASSANGERTPWSNLAAPHAEFEHGVARFPYVGLGLELEVEANWLDWLAPARSSHFGPTKPGDDVAIEIGAQFGPNGTVGGADAIAVTEGQEIVEPIRAFISSRTLENDRFLFCFEPDGPSSDTGRGFRLHFDSANGMWSGWHWMRDEPLSHFFFELDANEAMAVSRAFRIPIARRVARPYAIDAQFELDNSVHALGTPIRVTMHAKNVGATELSIDRHGWERLAERHARFEFTIVKDGALQPDIGSSRPAGGMSAREVLAPGASFDEVAELSKWCLFDQSGTYEIDASYELHIDGTPIPFEGGAGCAEQLARCTDHLRGHFQVIVR